MLWRKTDGATRPCSMPTTRTNKTFSISQLEEHEQQRKNEGSPFRTREFQLSQHYKPRRQVADNKSHIKKKERKTSIRKLNNLKNTNI